MIVWIQIQMQGTSNPTVKVLGDTYLTTDITGMGLPGQKITYCAEAN